MPHPLIATRAHLMQDDFFGAAFTLSGNHVHVHHARKQSFVEEMKGKSIANHDGREDGAISLSFDM